MPMERKVSVRHNDEGDTAARTYRVRWDQVKNQFQWVFVVANKKTEWYVIKDHVGMWRAYCGLKPLGSYATKESAQAECEPFAIGKYDAAKTKAKLARQQSAKAKKAPGLEALGAEAYRDALRKTD